MTILTQEAPSQDGANHGDAGAFNQPDLSAPDPRGLNTSESIPARDKAEQAARLREHNEYVWRWGERFDRKYRKTVKTLGWMLNLDSGYACFGVATFRKKYKSHKGFGEISRASVFRKFGELDDAGVITRVHRYDAKGRQLASLYSVDFSAVIQDGRAVRLGEATVGAPVELSPVDALGVPGPPVLPDTPPRPPEAPRGQHRAYVADAIQPVPAVAGLAPQCSRDGCGEYDGGRGLCYKHQAEEDAPPERTPRLRMKWNRPPRGTDGGDWE